MPKRPAAVLLMLLLALFLARGAPARAEGVRLATLAWEPYIGPELVEDGYVAAIAREALARSGLAAHLTYLPWKRALEMTRRGDFQGYFPEYHDPALERDFAFSDPIPGGPLALFVRPGAGFEYHGIEDLRPLRIGVVRGYVNTRAIDGADWLVKDEATSDLENLRKLLAGRVDVAVTDAYVGRHLARRYLGGVQAIALLAELEDKPLYLCVPRARADHQDILRAFNAGLAALRADGGVERIMARHGFEPTGADDGPARPLP